MVFKIFHRDDPFVDQPGIRTLDIGCQMAFAGWGQCGQTLSISILIRYDRVHFLSRMGESVGKSLIFILFKKIFMGIDKALRMDSMIIDRMEEIK